MAVVATGFFDGVHPGHRLVIDTLLSEARSRGEQSVVVTFWPHPRAVLQSDADSLRYLTSRADRFSMLRSLGVDEVETVPFTKGFAAMSARDYVAMLCRDYDCSALVLGYDTRFGREQSGPAEIAAVAREFGVSVITAPAVEIDGAAVSSSRIRSALEAGDTVAAARLLGRPYRLHGVVVAGNRLGRTIGFPTANMKLYEPLMAIPKNGVYATKVLIGCRSFANAQDDNNVILTGAERSGRIFTGMTNIGTRPTVGSDNALTIETHILDFDEMIYGLDISLEFHERIRDERKFASLSDLKTQLQADAAAVSG